MGIYVHTYTAIATDQEEREDLAMSHHDHTLKEHLRLSPNRQRDGAGKTWCNVRWQGRMEMGGSGVVEGGTRCLCKSGMMARACHTGLVLVLQAAV